MNRRTPLFLLIWIALLLGSAIGSGSLMGQGFTIERFQVDLYLSRDGSFSVEEKIHTNFSERKHGIRRLLPYRYQSQAVEGELALNHFPGFSYITPLDSVRVEGHEYLVERETDYYNIRIGSGDSYVDGRVTYIIRYRVYGAINRFLKSDELYWNVNGNGWDVPTESVDITVHLPDGKLLDKSDYRLYTGRKGSQESDATGALAAGTFTARTTRPLEAYEGLTVILRLPTGYLKHEDPPLRVLADEFIAHDLRTEVELQEDGTALVTETLDLELKNGVSFLERPLGTTFPYSWLSDHLNHGTNKLMVEVEEATVIENGKKRTLPKVVANYGNYVGIELQRNAEAGRRKYQVRYRVWNAMEFSIGEGRFYFPWLSQNLGEPTLKATLVVRWPKGMLLERDRCQVVTSIVDRMDQRVTGDSIVLSSNSTIFKDFTASLAVVLHGDWKPIKLPMRLFSPGEYVQRHLVEVEIKENGSVHFDHRLALVNSSYEKEYEAVIRDEYHRWMETDYVTAKPQLFGSSGHFLRFDNEPDGIRTNTYNFWGTTLMFPIHNFFEKPGTLNEIAYSYSLYGLLKEDSTGQTLFNFPLIEERPFAADSVQIRIKLPNGLLIDSSAVRVYTAGSTEPFIRNVDLKISKGLVEGEVDPGMMAGERLMVRLYLPEGTVAGDRVLAVRLVLSNHPALLIPVIIFGIFLVLWFIFGRDKTLTRVVRYYPPEDMTPTEAGLLVDDKLHNRDLLALIYYWGAKGYLSIAETKTAKGKPDYNLKKLKGLPNSARNYEKTLFNALFLGRKSIRVSKLKNQYYIYMRTARSQVEAWAKKKKYFVPGTRAFGSTLRAVGIAIGIMVAIVTVYMLLFVRPLSDGNWGLVIGWGLSALVLWFFGRIMPRHGAYGMQKYAELRGFMDFVKTAERDRLRLLVEEDPAYFGLTLSYAVAMGMANGWVEKFGPLLTVPPSYYHSSSSGQFNTVIFNQMLNNQLTAMSRNFNSSPAPSGGGGGSYSSSSSSSSWSSSSYSSSGSSGSSGYSSGGGYSGGGYGGGGGSSW